MFMSTSYLFTLSVISDRSGSVGGAVGRIKRRRERERRLSFHREVRLYAVNVENEREREGGSVTERGERDGKRCKC